MKEHEEMFWFAKIKAHSPNTYDTPGEWGVGSPILQWYQRLGKWKEWHHALAALDQKVHGDSASEAQEDALRRRQLNGHIDHAKEHMDVFMQAMQTESFWRKQLYVVDAQMRLEIQREDVVVPKQQRARRRHRGVGAVALSGAPPGPGLVVVVVRLVRVRELARSRLVGGVRREFRAQPPLVLVRARRDRRVEDVAVPPFELARGPAPELRLGELAEEARRGAVARRRAARTGATTSPSATT